MNSLIRSLQSLILPTRAPVRTLHENRLRLFAAVGAGIAAMTAFLLVYYGTLGILPRPLPVTDGTYPGAPIAAWRQEFDLAQFFGTLVLPPVPTALTWLIGFVLLAGSLVGAGVAYALLLAWGVQKSDGAKGVGFGGLLWGGLSSLLWVANGFHPAVMRNALPDTGFFMLGWSGWAALQFLVSCLAFGGVLGRTYQAWTRGK